MGRFARCAQVVIAAALLSSAATVGVSVSPAAAADTPTVTVNPHDQLIDGQRVAVEVSGFPTDPDGSIWGVAECPTTFFQDPVAQAEPSSIIIHCSLGVGPTGGSPNGSYEVIASATVRPFLPGNPTVDCTSVEGGCAIGVLLQTPTTGAELVVAYQAITFVGRRTLTVDAAATTTGVRSGDAVGVSGTLFPPGEATFAQCPGPVANQLELGACRKLGSADVAATGSFATTVTVTDPFHSIIEGPTIGCTGRCHLAVLASDGRIALSPPLVFRAGSISAPPGTSFVVGQEVLLTLNGWTDSAGAQLQVQQCPAGATRQDQCDSIRIVTIDAGGTGAVRFPVRGSVRSTDCLVAACEIAAFKTTDEGDVPLGPLPITVVPPTTPTLRLTPSSSNLWDGALIDGSAIGLVPGQRYRVARCDLSGTPSVRSCEALAAAPSIVAGSDTTASLRTHALQRLTTPSYFPYRYCRRQCGIGLVDDAGRLVVTAPYTIDPGVVIATPSSGLGDGDPVALTGVNLQPSYSGPTVLFPTGQWATAQCDASIGANPSLYEVFEHCASPTGGGVVNPTIGSQVQVTIRPSATMTTILGGTTDCTASPGACVVGLVRWEQDASVSTVFTPITFG